jgi:RimJ/RimL family protein N-acetyltransferase
MTGVPPIRCERFDLVWLSLEMIDALLAGDIDRVARALNVRFPDEQWLDDAVQGFQFRRDDMQRDPDVAAWMARLIVLPDRRAAGHVNFHGPPDADGICELGYAVFGAYRRQGIAFDAARCMMRWARETHGVRRFRLSIAPDNAPSLAMADKLGFVRTGEQMDEIDGLEYVFERSVM